MATIIKPTTGEEELTGDPNSFQWGEGDWQGQGGSQKGREYYAWKEFSKIFGRNPTASELSMLQSAYAGDPNVPNLSTGNATVAQYFQSLANSPDRLRLREQENLKGKLPEHYGTIDQLFQSKLGRAASQEEKDHFASVLASGEADPYTVGEFLTQLPEATRKEDEQFRTTLRGETSAADARYFNEQILPGIQQNFAKSGRTFEGSGFANAAAQAAQQQNVNREGFLTNLSASQYGGNKANAYNDYLNSVGRLQAGQDYSRGRRDQLSDAYTGRVHDIQNYNMQKQAYDDYLKRYGKRSNPLMGAAQGAFSGALSGATVGGTVGGPMGAVVGGIGGGIGGGLIGGFSA